MLGYEFAEKTDKVLKKTNEPTAQNGPLVTQVKTMSTTGSVG